MVVRAATRLLPPSLPLSPRVVPAVAAASEEQAEHPEASGNCSEAPQAREQRCEDRKQRCEKRELLTATVNEQAENVEHVLEAMSHHHSMLRYGTLYEGAIQRRHTRAGGRVQSQVSNRDRGEKGSQDTQRLVEMVVKETYSGSDLRT